MIDIGSKAIQITAMLDGGMSVREIAARMGTSRRYVRKVRQRLGVPREIVTTPPYNYQDTVKASYGPSGGSLEINSLTVHTLEQALEVAQVDLEKWEVDRWTVNSWQVTMKVRLSDAEAPKTRTNYQVKVWLKPCVPRPHEIAMRGLVESIQSAPAPRKTYSLASGDYAGELVPADAHFAKFAWNPETLGGHMDLHVAKKVYVESCANNLVKMSAFPLQVIHVVVGNDMLHFENIQAVTPKGGHHLDVDGRLPKAIQAAQEAVIETIDNALEIAPVRIVWVPGNHDYHASYWLCEVLRAYYRDNPHVEVDNAPRPRKAALWGDLLVAWAPDASGRKLVSTVNMLPQYWPDLWGKSRWREWHVGHKHKAEVTKTTPVFTLGGTVVRQVAGLTTIDYWHMDEVFTDAVPACESFVWHKHDGVVAAFNDNIDYNRAA